MSSMRHLILVTLFAGVFSMTARADVYDRINDCERAGGGSCIYSLLRELAAGQSSGGSSVIPVLGNYKQTTNSILCQDQHLEPVIRNGVLSSVRLGWCGAVFNVEFPCAAGNCTDGRTSVAILDRRSYLFTNDTGASATFSIP